MVRFHKIHFIERKATRRIHMVWVRLTRKQTTSRPDKVWPDMWKRTFDAAKRKTKQNWIIEKPKLDIGKQLRGIFFIEPDDEEFKQAMRNTRNSWKFRCHQKCLVKHPEKLPRSNLPRYWETQDQICLYCRCRRTYENTIGRCTTKVS